MAAQARLGSPRGRTAMRTPNKKKLRIKGRGRKRTARIRNGIALRVIIGSRPISSILVRSRPSVNSPLRPLVLVNTAGLADLDAGHLALGVLQEPHPDDLSRLQGELAPDFWHEVVDGLAGYKKG